MAEATKDIAKQKYLNFKEIAAYSLGLFGFQAIVGLLNSYQAEFEPQSRRLQADTFLVKPVTEYQQREAVSQLLQKTTRRNETREEDE